MPAPRRRANAWTAVVALAAAAAFLPALANGWVDRDDRINFLDNPHFRGLGPAQVGWAFTTFHLGVYQPLGWLLLEAQYAAFGLFAPGYHLASLALHAAVAAALWALAVAVLTRCPWARAGGVDGGSIRAGAAAAAVLFAAHPLRVEAVAWASCQTYLPAALLAILSARAYLRRDASVGRARRAWLAASWALFVGAVLCKAAAAALPAALLVLDAYPLSRFAGTGRARRAAVAAAVVEKLPFWLVGAAALPTAVGAKYLAAPDLVTRGGGAAERLARACYAACFYPAKTVWPSGLAAVYEAPARASFAHPTVALCAVAVVGVTLAVTSAARRRPGLAAAWWAYLALLAPVSGLVRSGPEPVADRYAYLATVPLAVAAAGVLARRPRARAAAAALALVLGALSWRQCLTWRDTETLFARAAAVGAISPTSYRMELGLIREGRRRFDEAEACYREAVRLDPGRPAAANQLGAFLGRRGRTAEAVPWFERAVAADPGDAAAHDNLGRALAALGRLDPARQHFAEAVRLRPADRDARVNLARTLARLGRPREASAEYARALLLDPADPRARAGLAELVGTRPPARP